jgi:hypothetical protein
MSLIPGNAAMGPAQLYVGDFGATEPAETNAALNQAPGVAWTDCGGTLGGVSFSFGAKYKNLEFDQVTLPVGARKTDETVLVKVKLAEVTLANLDRIMSGGTLTAGTGMDSWVPEVALTSTAEPEYKAILLDGPGPSGERRRLILRKALNTNNINLEYQKDGQQVFEAEFTGFYVSSTVDAYKFHQCWIGS